MTTLDPVHARVAGTWAFRTRAEIEAAARFERLADEIALLSASNPIIGSLRRAAADERRHASLCAKIAARFGSAHADRHEPGKLRAGDPRFSKRDQLLWEIVSACCVGETMNASLLVRTLAAARDESIRAAVRDLLRDEIRHSRLGWLYLAHERKQGHGDFLSDAMSRILEASIEDDLFRKGANTLTDELRGLGELSIAERSEIFVTTLEQVVLPGLEQLDVGTKEARRWLEQKLGDCR